jgi:hypothetical protein
MADRVGLSPEEFEKLILRKNMVTVLFDFLRNARSIFIRTLRDRGGDPFLVEFSARPTSMPTVFTKKGGFTLTDLVYRPVFIYDVCHLAYSWTLQLSNNILAIPASGHDELNCAST